MRKFGGLIHVPVGAILGAGSWGWTDFSTRVDITKTLGAQRNVLESYVSLVMCLIGCVRSSLGKIRLPEMGSWHVSLFSCFFAFVV